MNADAESRGDAPQYNSVFLFLSVVVLHSVSSVIHGLIILTHRAFFFFTSLVTQRLLLLNASLLCFLINLY